MSENRILTSHVGSLVRPPEFIDILKEKKAGRPVPHFEAALSAAVKTVVQKQVDAGIDIVSDGEFGKGIGWEQYVIERLSGFSEMKPAAAGERRFEPQSGDFRRFPEFYAEVFAKDAYEERPFPCTGAIT
jgi:5-methyltetrahydropteroyltriglutamate--homocysteine methyltransferase